MLSHFPVAWLSVAVAALTAGDAAAEQASLLTPLESSIVGLVIAVLTLAAGRVAHNAVTPLARPRDSSGRPLVPLSSAASKG